MTAEDRLTDELARIDALLPGLAEEPVDEALIAATLQRVADEPAMAPRIANEPPPPPRMPRFAWAIAALFLVALGGVWMTQLSGMDEGQPMAAYAPEPEAAADSIPTETERIQAAIRDNLARERREIQAREAPPSAAAAADVGMQDALAGISLELSPEDISFPADPRVEAPSGSSGGTDSGSSVGRPDAQRLADRRVAKPRPRPGRVTWTSPEPTPMPTPRPTRAGGESYRAEAPSPWKSVAQQPLSTLSIDVDTASYTNVRRFLTWGRLPPPEAVRIEELLNWFEYSDPAPRVGEQPPFGVGAEVSTAPWNEDHLLVRVALRAATIPADQVPPRNLVFLVDVSGSMKAESKLPLLQRSMTLLAADLRPEDTMAIVSYAGRSAVELEPTTGRNKGAILAAIDGLTAGGSTNGEGGIRTAYNLAKRNFDRDGINRVILATDGDFNVGTSDRGSLIGLIEQQRESGVFLTALGFGTGNFRDDTLEALADHGNGNYAYIDGLEEAHKVLTAGAGKLVTVAKDVKLQVEFNPAQVEGWRLLGYENRVMSAREFRDDKKDAGEMQSGDGVTALFELVPAGGSVPQGSLRYQKAPADLTEAARSGELLVVHTRWKEPQGRRAKEESFIVEGKRRSLRFATDDFQTSAAVAGWGMLLRRDPEVGTWSYDDAATLAKRGVGDDPDGQRSELVELIRRSGILSRR